MTEGAICIDGQDVRTVTQESLRQNVGVVQQEVFLFAASILENIRYGKPGATEEEVAQAARLAEIYDDCLLYTSGSSYRYLNNSPRRWGSASWP